MKPGQGTLVPIPRWVAKRCNLGCKPTWSGPATTRSAPGARACHLRKCFNQQIAPLLFVNSGQKQQKAAPAKLWHDSAKCFDLLCVIWVSVLGIVNPIWDHHAVPLVLAKARLCQIPLPIASKERRMRIVENGILYSPINPLLEVLEWVLLIEPRVQGALDEDPVRRVRLACSMTGRDARKRPNSNHNDAVESDVRFHSTCARAEKKTHIVPGSTAQEREPGRKWLPEMASSVCPGKPLRFPPLPRDTPGSAPSALQCLGYFTLFPAFCRHNGGRLRVEYLIPNWFCILNHVGLRP